MANDWTYPQEEDQSVEILEILVYGKKLCIKKFFDDLEESNLIAHDFECFLFFLVSIFLVTIETQKSQFISDSHDSRNI